MPTNLLPRRSTRPATHIWISAVVTEGTTSKAGRTSTCSFGNRGTFCSAIATGLKSIEAFQASLRIFLHRFGRKASCQCHRHRSSLERGLGWAPQPSGDKQRATYLDGNYVEHTDHHISSMSPQSARVLIDVAEKVTTKDWRSTFYDNPASKAYCKPSLNSVR